MWTLENRHTLNLSWYGLLAPERVYEGDSRAYARKPCLISYTFDDGDIPAQAAKTNYEYTLR